MTQIFTIGHSTHELANFIEMLANNNVKQLVDIRTVPRSRHNPQYEQMSLEKVLPEANIGYSYIKKLGGLRPKAKNSRNLGWRNQSFRNYADYMQTDEFSEGIQQLIKLSKQKTVAIMCAEAVPWRCHRSLVADALVAQGLDVGNIMSTNSTIKHKITSFAVINGTSVTYPDEEVKR